MENDRLAAFMAAYLIGGLLVLPVVGAIVQIYRDSRGAARNRANRCYACDGRGLLLPVPHYKGRTYLYCRRCSIRQQNWSQLVLGVALLLAVGAGLLWLVLA